MKRNLPPYTPLAIAVNSETRTATIEVEGVIGMPEWYEQYCTEVENPDLVTTKEKLRSDLKALKNLDQSVELIKVYINSFGGDVNHALDIHDQLVSHPAKVMTIIGGMSASAATIIAQAADPGMRKISENAFYLAHRARGVAWGTVSDIKAYAGMLEKVDTRIAKIYARHSGRTVEEHLADMSKANEEGEWQTADDTVAGGYADETVPMAGLPAAATARFGEDLLRLSGIKTLPKGYTPAKPDTSGTGRIEQMFNTLLAHITPSGASKSKATMKTVILGMGTHAHLLTALAVNELNLDDENGAYLNREQLDALNAATKPAAPAAPAPVDYSPLLSAAGIEAAATPEATQAAIVAEITRLRALPGASIPRTVQPTDPLEPKNLQPWEDPERSYNKALHGLGKTDNMFSLNPPKKNKV